MCKKIALWGGGAVVAVIVIGALSGADQTTTLASSPAAEQVTTRSTTTVSAVAGLKALPVKGRAAKTGYTRAQFGQAWMDADRNDCDTRNDILRRDLQRKAIAANGCTVRSGLLNDPYTGTLVSYTAGGSTLQVDHVVALANAWVTGAARLTLARRTAFANDPLNLLTTTAAVNERKGSGDAATWLPPRTAFRCAYVARQIAVKRTYGLWVTKAEHDAMARILAACPRQMLTTALSAAPPRILITRPSLTTGPKVTTAPTVGPTEPTTTVAPTATTTTSVSIETTTIISTTTSSTTSAPTFVADPRFATCAAAKAAGYGPYYRGRDVEYHWYRDADGDGIVCE